MHRKKFILMNHTNMQGHHFGGARVMRHIEQGLLDRGGIITGRIDGKMDWRKDALTLRLLPTACSACANAAQPASTSSTNSAPNWASSTVWHHRSTPKPTAWSSASTAGSKRCFNRTTSIQARNWKPRCTAMCCSTISNFPSQPWEAKLPCRR